MTIVNKPLIESRSAIEADWGCGMYYYWNQLHGGRGIVPKAEAVNLLVGRQTHEDMAFVATCDLDEQTLIDYAVEHILPPAGEVDQLLLEPAYRRAGWFFAFALYMEPDVRATWNTVMMEDEIVLERGDYWLELTPDRILQSIANPSQYVYREYKSVKNAGQSWQEHWPYAIQLHAGLQAVEEELGIKLSYGQIMGLEKGYLKDGKLRHPYVWAYSDGADHWQTDYRRDLTLRPVWEYPGGILAWVKFLGRPAAVEQFPLSRPIFKDERLVETTVRRRIIRLTEVREVQAECQTDLDKRAIHFEQRWKQCRPPYGDRDLACPYLACCHNAVVQADPLRTGDYVVRTPHHELELVMEGQ